MFSSIRKNVYWFLDKLKGSRVKKNYDEINKMLNSPDDSYQGSLQEKYISTLLKHSVSSTKFYSQYTDYSSLKDFPLIDKNIVKSKTEEFLSSVYNKNDLHKVTTSGSTGAPLTVYQDKRKRQRHIAENIFFSDVIGYTLGTRLYYLRVWNQINKKSLLTSLMQNVVMQDADDLSDNSLEIFINRLRQDKSRKSILAFASTLEALSSYIKKHSVDLSGLKLNCIISISETLPDGAKKVLKQSCNCPVICRYSNMENGFLAQQCTVDNEEYHLNTASFYFELLHPDKDEPTMEGEIGRVVVTDLFNYAMPLIRYDTGDMAILSKKSSCGKPGIVFKSIEGRRVDFIYDTLGNLLSPHVITNTMWKYASIINQFQFIQHSERNYLIKLNGSELIDNSVSEIISDIKKYVGSDAIIDYEVVDEIPLLSSGKRKKIVNNYKPIV